MSMGRFGAITCPLMGLFAAPAAFAEPASQTAPLVSDGLKEYEPTGIDFGGVRVLPTVQYILYGDDNVYAAPSAKRGDAVFNVLAGLDARHRVRNLEFRGLATTNIRRYFDLSSENSESATVEGAVNWQPRQTENLNFTGGWYRTVEDRGDPEALNLQSTGPRLTNMFGAQVRYRQEGARFVVTSDLAMRKYDVLGPLNDERDFSSQFGSLTLGYRIGGSAYATVTGYANRRDFRLAVTSAGINQDATTVGGRVGIDLKPGGTIEGQASVGLFRLNFKDPTLSSRSGLSAEAAIIYRPRRRTAITLGAFAGDVATFRLGATARNDKRVNLAIQQEARHNLYGTFGLGIRESKFVGSGVKERTLSPSFEVEYLASRTMSLAGYVTYAKRTSDDPIEKFERLRGGISLRLRY